MEDRDSVTTFNIKSHRCFCLKGVNPVIFTLSGCPRIGLINEFHTDIKFTYESSKESIAFLDLKVSVKNSKIITDLYVKSTDRHQYLHYLSAHPNHTKRSAVLARLCVLVGCAVMRKIL